jgi:hypothetical protein
VEWELRNPYTVDDVVGSLNRRGQRSGRRTRR